MGKIVSPNLLSLEDDLWRLYCDIRAMTNDGDAVRLALEAALDGRVVPYSIRVYSGHGYVVCDLESKLIRAAEWALKKEEIQ